MHNCSTKKSHISEKPFLVMITQLPALVFFCMVSCNIKIFFFQNWSNLHDRSGIGWIERKTKFQIFNFRVMVIIWSTPQFPKNFFTITREIKIGEFSYYFCRSAYPLLGQSPFHSEQKTNLNKTTWKKKSTLPII